MGDRRRQGPVYNFREDDCIVVGHIRLFKKYIIIIIILNPIDTKNSLFSEKAEFLF